MGNRKEIHSLNDQDSDILILIPGQHSILTNKQTMIAQLVKNPPAGGPGTIPGLGRLAGEAKGYPLQHSGLENSMGSQRVRHNWATFTFTQKVHNNVTQVFNPVLLICWFMLCHKNLPQEGSFNVNRICSTSCMLWLEQTQLNCILFSEIAKASMLRVYDRVVVV